MSKDALKEAVRLETPKKFADLNLAAVDEGFALRAEAPVDGVAALI